MIYINSEKLMFPGRWAPVEFFSWKCGKLRKTAKSGYPALTWPFRTSLFSALSWNKISHMKLQSLKMFKMTKDMFYKQFEFFANWQGRLWGFVNLVLWMSHHTIRKWNTLYISASEIKKGINSVFLGDWSFPWTHWNTWMNHFFCQAGLEAGFQKGVVVLDNLKKKYTNFPNFEIHHNSHKNYIFLAYSLFSDVQHMVCCWFCQNE